MAAISGVLKRRVTELVPEPGVLHLKPLVLEDVADGLRIAPAGCVVQGGFPFGIFRAAEGELLRMLQHDLHELPEPASARGVQGRLAILVARVEILELLVCENLVDDRQIALSHRSVQERAASLPPAVHALHALFLHERRQPERLLHYGHLEAILSGLVNDVLQVRYAEGLVRVLAHWLTSEEDVLLLGRHVPLEPHSILDPRDIPLPRDFHPEVFPTAVQSCHDDDEFLIQIHGARKRGGCQGQRAN
mmetsp:Transcript_45606/g.126563  ORF Transcript_45606/g.126563 Transcript_45606/m.126563 type:complete len:248 (+) Transcript_45606:2208-2951(+)